MIYLVRMKTKFPFYLFIIVLLGWQCAPSRKNIAARYDVSIVPRSGWNALPPKPYKQHTPQQITVHHEGTRLEITDDAARKIHNIQVWGMGKDRNWADIPYHFLIAPDGTIYEGRDVNTVGETATEYDPTGHLLITCLGNLQQQEVPEQQLNALIRLMRNNQAHIFKLNPRIIHCFTDTFIDYSRSKLKDFAACHVHFLNFMPVQVTAV